MAISKNIKHHVVVVGGGFGGVKAALELAKTPNISVTLISQIAEFSYYPQLYHAATGGSRAEAAIPLAELFESAPIEIVRATIVSVNAETKTLKAESGAEFTYDDLILSLGSVTNYFGIKGLDQFSYNIKTIGGAEVFKQHLHQQLVTERRPDVNYVVIGGGPTGVELSGALAEYLHRITLNHGVAANIRIDLVEAAPRILPRSSARAAAKVEKRLKRLGVNIMCDSVVEAATAEGLEVKGQSIASRTVVWTAGVANNPFYKSNAEVINLTDRGKVIVDDHMQSRDSIYVIGDNADTKYAGLAQTAVSDGKFAAADITRKFNNDPRPAYKQTAPFPVVPVGDRWAAATIGKLEFFGYAGWILRRLGDLVAYADIESVPKALKVWNLDSRREDDCPICKQPAPLTNYA